MQNNKYIPSCLKFVNCDFCDARCPDYVNSQILYNFLSQHKDFLHDLSIKEIERK